MEIGDIDVYHGAEGELYYQRWDGENWSEPARMIMETIEVLTLKSRIKRLETALTSVLELARGHNLSTNSVFQKAYADLEDGYVE